MSASSSTPASIAWTRYSCPLHPNFSTNHPEEYGMYRGKIIQHFRLDTNETAILDKALKSYYYTSKTSMFDDSIKSVVIRATEHIFYNIGIAFQKAKELTGFGTSDWNRGIQMLSSKMEGTTEAVAVAESIIEETAVHEGIYTGGYLPRSYVKHENPYRDRPTLCQGLDLFQSAFLRRTLKEALANNDQALLPTVAAYATTPHCGFSNFQES